MFALILAAVAAGGCAKKPAAAVSVSGVAGTVKVGPLCPVARQSSPCPDNPVQALIDVVDQAGHRSGPYTTKADGTFRIPLPPGTYVVSAREVGDNPRLAKPLTVTVVAGKFATVNPRIITGILGPTSTPSTPGY